MTQLSYSLRESLFVHERTEEALFMPPLKYSAVLKSAGVFERVGRFAVPIVSGVHIVEAGKQVYASADPGSGSKVRVRGRGIFIPKPAASGFKG